MISKDEEQPLRLKNILKETKNNEQANPLSA